MKKVVCIAAKIKKTLAPLVENKLSGCEVIWLEELDAEARRKAILRSDIMLASLLTVELSAEEKKLLGRLEMVQTMSAGVDQIDFSTLPENVNLYSNTGGWAHAMAEHALAMALASTRMLRPQTEALKGGRFDIYGYPMRLLSQCTTLIVGFGGIGREAARLFKAMGSHVQAVGRSAPQHDLLDRGWAMTDFEKALPEADIVLLSLPSTSLTHHLLNARTLSLMKDDATLINVARAGLIDHDALEAHLRAHPRFFAALDVWWQERSAYPADGDSLLSLPNVIGTAHNSYASPTAAAEAAENALGNILDFIAGLPVKGRAAISEYTSQKKGE